MIIFAYKHLSVLLRNTLQARPDHLGGGLLYVAREARCKLLGGNPEDLVHL